MAERYTRQLEVLVGESSWEFDSPRSHHFFFERGETMTKTTYDEARRTVKASLLRLLAQTEPSQRTRATTDFFEDLEKYLDARDHRVIEESAARARLVVEESKKLGTHLKELLRGKG